MDLAQRKAKMNTPEKILCPTDFKQAASVALAASCEMAKAYSASLILLNVVSPVVEKEGGDADGKAGHAGNQKNKAKKCLIDSLSRLVPESIKVKAVLAQGDPAEKILQVAEKEKVDMIILPSPPKGALLKNDRYQTTQKLIKQADCSLYLVKV